MGKMLHEKMREWADRGLTGLDLGAELGCHGKGMKLIWDGIADELERFYLPRPCFDDGDPVQFGDEVKGCYGCVESMLLFEDGSGSVYGKDDYSLPEDDCGADIGSGLKRASKILDANGVACYVGEHVWNIHTGCEYEIIGLPGQDCYQSVAIRNVETGSTGGVDGPNLTHERLASDSDGLLCKVGDRVWDMEGLYDVPLEVLSINESGTVKVSIPDGKGWTCYSPKNLSHERPVFDINRKRIREGDEVWAVYGNRHFGKRLVVTGIKPDEEDQPVFVKFDDGNRCWMKPDTLTHAKQYTLNEIHQFAVDHAAYAEGSERDAFLEIADQLSGFIKIGDV